MAKIISEDLTNNNLCILEYTTTDGQMLSFKEDAFDAKIVSHTYTDIGKVIFDKPITRIGERAFFWRTSLTSVTIPDSVTTIGKRAFDWCISLTSVTIPNSVTTIGKCAFAWCKSLTSVTIPDSVTTIGDGAFAGCKSLTSVTICNGVTTIGSSTFALCTRLKEFKGKFAADDGCCLIIDGVLNAFAIGCGVTQYTIPDSVQTIGKRAFSRCTSLASVTIPDSVMTIGNYAFSECNSLKNITIGKGVSEIGENAFNKCNIDTIVCCSKTPPKIDGSFDKFENLIVPTDCEEAYANSDWGKYLE